MVQNLLKSSVPKRWAWLTKPSGVGFVCPQTALNVQRFPEQITGPRRLHINRVGQNHIYTVHMRCFGQGNYQIHGHERCIYTVLASSTPKRCTHTCSVQQGRLPAPILHIIYYTLKVHTHTSHAVCSNTRTSRINN
jgi:hypothetical protein